MLCISHHSFPLVVACFLSSVIKVLGPLSFHHPGSLELLVSVKTHTLLTIRILVYPLQQETLFWGDRPICKCGNYGHRILCICIPRLHKPVDEPQLKNS